MCVIYFYKIYYITSIGITVVTRFSGRIRVDRQKYADEEIRNIILTVCHACDRNTYNMVFVVPKVYKRVRAISTGLIKIIKSWFFFL